MSIDAVLKAHRDEILAIASRHGATNVRVFGSVVRREAGPDSDVDFLVDLESGGAFSILPSSSSTSSIFCTARSPSFAKQ